MWPWNCINEPNVFGNNDGIWFTNYERYEMGGFSMAARRANIEMEDYSQVEVGDKSIFVGIYDGRGGNKGAKLFSNVLLQKLLRQIHENSDVISYDLLIEAITATKKQFVGQQDSSCLISLVWKDTLYIANLGDSRLVIGTEVGDTSVLKVEQLTSDQSSKLMTHRRIIRDDDRCLILASSGFWKIMKNEEAMLIVERYSKHGIAKRLLQKALEKVATEEKTTINELVSCDDRKKYHDDITVIVIFINQGKSRNVPPKLSYRAPSSLLEPLKSIFAIDPSNLVVDETKTKAKVKPVKVNPENKSLVIKETPPPSPPPRNKVPEVDHGGKGKGTLVDENEAGAKPENEEEETTVKGFPEGETSVKRLPEEGVSKINNEESSSEITIVDEIEVKPENEEGKTLEAVPEGVVSKINTGESSSKNSGRRLGCCGILYKANAKREGEN